MSLGFIKTDILKGVRFTVSSNSICISPQKDFLLIAGTYKPSFKQLSLELFEQKFERHGKDEYRKVKYVDNENFICLTFGKRIEFHKQTGLYEEVIMDSICRDVDVIDNHVYIGSTKIYAIDLNKGTKEKPLEKTANCISCFYPTSCLGYSNYEEFGFFDLRQPAKVYSREKENISSIAINDSGNCFCITTDEQVIEYDFRNFQVLSTINILNATNVKYRNNLKFFVSNEKLFVDKETSLFDYHNKINDYEVHNDNIFICGESEEVSTIRIIDQN